MAVFKPVQERVLHQPEGDVTSRKATYFTSRKAPESFSNRQFIDKERKAKGRETETERQAAPSAHGKLPRHASSKRLPGGPAIPSPPVPRKSAIRYSQTDIHRLANRPTNVAAHGLDASPLINPAAVPSAKKRKATRKMGTGTHPKCYGHGHPISDFRSIFRHRRTPKPKKKFTAPEG